MRSQIPPNIRSHNYVSKIVTILQNEPNIMGTWLMANSLSGNSLQDKKLQKNHDNYLEIIIFIIFTIGCIGFIFFLCLASHSINCFVYYCFNFGCVILQLVCMEYFLVSLNVFVNNSKRYYSVLIQLYHTLSISLLLETHYFLFSTIVITNGVNNFPHTSLCTSGIF